MFSIELEKKILELTNSSSIESIELIQKLWSDYGSLYRVCLNGDNFNSVVIKQINFKKKVYHPRGWATDKSHKRKLESYNVEINFYKYYNLLCTENSYFPKYYYSENNSESIILILEDLLQTGFPKVISNANDTEIKLCLNWLAYFHAKGFNAKTNLGIWEKGSYWHLGTREDEFNKMAASDLKKCASKIDDELDSALFKTIIHGDAKIANFCFSNNSDSVAAVDFQYVGFGTPVKDLVYFLGSILSGKELESKFNNYKKYYYNKLVMGLKDKNHQIDYDKLIMELEVLWPFAVADFERFLLGWMPSHHKLTDFSKEVSHEVLQNLIKR